MPAPLGAAAAFSATHAHAVPSADINWLLSTEVQSGAALVAIVGGLLVARLLGLSGDRTLLRREITDAQDELTLARDRLRDAADQLGNLNADAFLTHGERVLLDLGGNIGDDDLRVLIQRSGWPLTDRDIRDVVRPSIDTIRSAFQKASALAFGQEEPMLPRALTKGLTPEFGRDLARKVAGVMARRGELGATAQRNAQLPVLASRLGSAEDAAAQMQTRDRRIDDAQRRVAEDRAEVRRREVRLKTLTEERSQAAKPAGRSWIFAGLGYLTVACVAAPLGLMAWGRTALPAWSRGVIVALFVSGLAVFAIVIVGLLRKQPDETGPPSVGCAR
jgi:hypothetical protein